MFNFYLFFSQAFKFCRYSLGHNFDTDEETATSPHPRGERYPADSLQQGALSRTEHSGRTRSNPEASTLNGGQLVSQSPFSTEEGARLQRRDARKQYADADGRRSDRTADAGWSDCSFGRSDCPIGRTLCKRGGDGCYNDNSYCANIAPGGSSTSKS